MVPEDAVGPGCMFLKVPVEANGDKFVPVFVSNVYSMDHFHIQLIGEGTTNKLERLMDRIE